MKFFKRLVFGILAFSIALLIYVIAVFQVEDTTLSKGDIYEFNRGWTLSWQEAQGEKKVSVDELPFLGECAPDTLVIMSNTIPEEYFGKTMSFLSADKTLKVWIDGTEVYEFGIADKRTFGKTPGSIVNFIDIPGDLEHGEIKIEMCSPYADCAARISTITVGNRDVLILKLLKIILSVLCLILRF